MQPPSPQVHRYELPQAATDPAAEALGPSDIADRIAGKVAAGEQETDVLKASLSKALERVAAAADLAPEEMARIAQASGYQDGVAKLVTSAEEALGQLKSKLTLEAAPAEADTPVAITVVGAPEEVDFDAEEILAAAKSDEDDDAEEAPEPQAQAAVVEASEAIASPDRRHFIDFMHAADTAQAAVQAIEGYANGSEQFKSGTGETLATSTVTSAFRGIDSGKISAKSVSSDPVVRETAERLIRGYVEKGISEAILREVEEVKALPQVDTPKALIEILDALLEEKVKPLYGEHKARHRAMLKFIKGWAEELIELTDAGEDLRKIPNSPIQREMMPFRRELEDAMRRIVSKTRTTILESDQYRNRMGTASVHAQGIQRASSVGGRRQAVYH